MAAPLLKAIEIQGKTITADAWLTQRAFATYLIDDRKAHYHLTVKGNQPHLLQNIVRYFETRQAPDFVETRKIWTTSAIEASLNFPHVGQVFIIERERLKKTTGTRSLELAYGITSRPPDQATPQQVLTTNRGHWSIENSCHSILNCNWDEDRSRIRTKHGQENVSRLRRFAISLIKAKGVNNVAQKIRQLQRSKRLLFDYLQMSKNSCGTAAT
jgi:predicted transposase YbfD/YdcC